MPKDDDRLRAAAESRLERLDDARIDETDPDPTIVAEVIPDDEVGMHVDDGVGGADQATDEAVATSSDEADAIDALAEAFNARDLDRLLELVADDAEVPGLLGYDRDNLSDALEELWQRRPSCCLTRGYDERGDLGVLWEHDGATWWRAATVHVADVVEGRVGVFELSEDAALLDVVASEPPDPGELQQGARWSEWAEGDDAPSTNP